MERKLRIIKKDRIVRIIEGDKYKVMYYGWEVLILKSKRARKRDVILRRV